MKFVIAGSYKFFTALFLLISICSRGQQILTQTITSTNRNCNSGCSVLDTSIFHNKSAAVILLTPVFVNGVNQNQHSVGAYYMYLNTWSIYNLDATSIGVGAKYNVEYWLTPDANHFVYVVPARVNINDVSYIDHVGLNNNPNAQIRFTPRITYIAGPGNIVNKDDVKILYDATVAKWYIANINNTPVPSGSAYSIVISNGSGTTNPNGNTTGGGCNCDIPSMLPPNGSAGGDLNGTYPNPIVKGIQGRPVSTIQPSVGDILQWDGTSWVPSVINTANTSQNASGAKPSVLYFNQTGNVYMDNPNVDISAVGGMDNQVFTVTQSSRVVFHTVLWVITINTNTIMGTHATGVQVISEILNASNQVVGKSTSDATLTVDQRMNINSTGIGVLPAGNYHTRVTIKRQGGGEILYSIPLTANQNGQMIIEIFPD